MSLTTALKPLFNSGDRNRGSSYFHDGLVYEMKITDGLLVAEVEGPTTAFTKSSSTLKISTTKKRSVAHARDLKVVFIANTSGQRSWSSNPFTEAVQIPETVQIPIALRNALRQPAWERRVPNGVQLLDGSRSCSKSAWGRPVSSTTQPALSRLLPANRPKFTMSLMPAKALATNRRSFICRFSIESRKPMVSGES